MLHSHIQSSKDHVCGLRIISFLTVLNEKLKLLWCDVLINNMIIYLKTGANNCAL